MVKYTADILSLKYVPLLTKYKIDPCSIESDGRLSFFMEITPKIVGAQIKNSQPEAFLKTAKIMMATW